MKQILTFIAILCNYLQGNLKTKKRPLRWLLTIFLCCVGLGSRAETVEIAGFAPVGTYNDCPLFVIENSPITVGISGGSFNYIYVDDKRVVYNGLSYLSSYSLDISSYLDGGYHKIQLKHSSDYSGICYFIGVVEKVSISGIEYSLVNDIATVIGAINDIEEADIPATITKNDSDYSVKSISPSAFANQTKLHTVTIPESVTSIEGSAFSGCSALTTLNFNAIKCERCGDYHYPAFPSTITNLTIGEKVTKIPDYFLYNGSKIENLTIPESVINIGNSAFIACSALTTLNFNAINCENSVTFPSSVANLTIGENVTRIPDNFLNYGSKIENLTIPNSVTSIGSYAFQNSTSLKGVVIPPGVTTIGEFAFWECNNLVKSAYPDNLSNPFSSGVSIAYSKECNIDESGCIYNSDKTTVYYAPVSLSTSYQLPANITQIGRYAFYNCANIIAINIPESVTSIGAGAFSGCSALTTLNFNAISCESCGSSSFPSTISKLTIGDKVTKIPDYFLYGGSKIENLTIPESVTIIGNSAFSGCTALTSITLSESVTSIGGYAFSGCSALSSITIPERVTSIGNSAFSGCNALTTLNFNAINCTTCGWLNYAAFPSAITDLTIGEKVTKIPDYFLDNGSIIENLTIPNSVTSIGSCAFRNNKSLKSLTLGAGIRSIGGEAFSYYSYPNYKKMSIPKVFWLGNTPPEGYENISGLVNYVANDQYSFENQVKYQFLSSKFSVDGIAYVPVIPAERTCDVVDCIYGQPFGDLIIADNVVNKGIKMVVNNIQQYAFYENTNIKSLTLNNQGFIGDNAFYNSLNINEITISGSVTSLGSSIFSGCSKLKQISIPKSVQSIGDKAFYGCTQLSDITFENALRTEPNSEPDVILLGSNGENPLFSSCPLDEVYIGRKLSYDSSAEKGCSPFYRNTSLRTVEITDAETEIYDNEFYGCSNLKSLQIGNGVKKIGNRAFSGCSALDYFSSGCNVETIGNEAFSDCTGLTKFYSHSKLPPVCGDQALDDINKWECTLYVPEQSSDEYRAAPQWKDFFFIEENADAGVGSVLVDNDSEMEVYDLQGRMVGTSLKGLKAGIYIVKQGGTTSKVAVN